MGPEAAPPIRPRAYERTSSLWNLSCVEKTVAVNGQVINHPGRTCGIFVVHGIGRRLWTETSATLRSGFEDAMEEIKTWQRDEQRRGAGIPPGAQVVPFEQIPPPFVYDGYWSDYQDVEATFKETWARFAPRERTFFQNLWKLRASIWSTFKWFIKQQVRLLHPNRVKDVGPWVYLFIFGPLQVVSLAALTLAFFRYRALYQKFLGDVRMYIAPRGSVERVIVQCIDYRVGKAFLQMIGLDWNFRPLLPCDQIEASGDRISFDRVVWVAHSLGTVISYNVLSDLFHRAAELERAGDKEQREGVSRFRRALRRFVTLGSPLQTIALLFGKEVLRPWPDGNRRALLLGGEIFEEGQTWESSEWWANFYHVLDPISAPVVSELICGKEQPSNYLLRSRPRLWLRAAFLPGWAHVDYWTDGETLRYILGRTYGREYLYDQQYHPWPLAVKIVISALGKSFWSIVLLLGMVVVVVEGLIQVGLLTHKDVLHSLLHLFGF